MDGTYQDVFRKSSVECSVDCLNRMRGVQHDVSHLTVGMDPAVGPACPNHRDPLFHEWLEGLLEEALDGPFGLLTLPPCEVRPVVGDGKFKNPLPVYLSPGVQRSGRRLRQPPCGDCLRRSSR